MTAGDNLGIKNAQTIPSDAYILVYSPSVVGGIIALPVQDNASGSPSATLSFERVTYTGTGDGTANNVTFAHKPRRLYIQTTAGAKSNSFIGNDANISIENGAKADTASTLFSSATVNIDALNTLFSLSGTSDINTIATNYVVYAIETA